MYVVGVDGCRTGWLAVKIIPRGSWEVAVFTTFAEFWAANRRASLILVDIPIGLKEGGPEERRCDKEARQILGPRKSSVFPVPCRTAVYQPDYDAAIKENLRLRGKSIFKAVWMIVPKIREVDEVLLEDASALRIVRESHPEVCFWALNRGKPMTHNKKTEAGGAERRGLLRTIFGVLQPSLAEFVDADLTFKRQDVAPDDFLDALVLAATALLGQNRGLATIPENTETDACGLPMEMVHVRIGAKK